MITTKQISDNIISQLEASLNQSIPLLPKSFNRVLAKAISGVFVITYKYAGFIALQQFVKTASIEETQINGVMVSPLKEWGRLIGVGDPAPATQSEYTVIVSVENQGGILPSGSQLLNGSNGVTYLTTASVSLDSDTIQVNIRASSDQSGGLGAGIIGNLEPGQDIVSFANPLSNVARDTVVLTEVVTGSDAEETEVYRQRIIERFRARPQGGALVDYRVWGSDSSGILRIYPYAGSCAGHVDVYVESSTEIDGVPTEAQLQEAINSINLDIQGLASRRPAGSLVNVFPISRSSFSVRVAGLSVENEAAVMQDIEIAISDYFISRQPFISGLSISPRLDRITRTSVGGVVDDVVSSAGGIFASVEVSRLGSVIEVYSLAIGELSKSGGVEFV